MPAGDPAGYLPSVRRSRKRKGQPVYQPRKPRRHPIGDPLTGVTRAPDFGTAPRPQFPKIKKPRRDGYPQPAPQLTHKRVRPGDMIKPPNLRRRRRGGRRRYMGRGE